MMRAQVMDQTELGRLCVREMKEDKVLPADVSIGLLKTQIKDLAANGATKFLVSGFPRFVDQAKLFEAKAAPVSRVLCLDCSVDTSVDRAKACGKLDLDGVARRHDSLADNWDGIAEYYAAENKFTRVDADQPLKKVANAVRQHACEPVQGHTVK